MQWTPGPNAGFDGPNAKPWLPVPPNASTINVQMEKSDPNSLLDLVSIPDSAQEDSIRSFPKAPTPCSTPKTPRC